MNITCKRVLFTAVVCCLLLSLKAQSIDRVSFSSGASNSDSFKSSIGAPYGANLSGANGSLTVSAEYGEETFKESGLVSISSVDESHVNLSVFPNPSILSINVQIESDVEFPVNLSLYDLTGVCVIDYQTSEKNSELNVEELAEGTYILRLTNGKNILKCFKIVKAN